MQMLLEPVADEVNIIVIARAKSLAIQRAERTVKTVIPASVKREPGLDCHVAPAPRNDGGIMELAQQRCEPCRSGMGKLTTAEITTLLGELRGWEWDDNYIFLKRRFADYAGALHFVNQVSVLAELEGHHPDISFGWGYAEIRLTSHAAYGLTKNDFILAAKIDALPR